MNRKYYTTPKYTPVLCLSINPFRKRAKVASVVKSILSTLTETGSVHNKQTRWNKKTKLVLPEIGIAKIHSLSGR